MKTNDQVAISVIVPVYNEEEILSSVMRELKEAMSSSSYGYEIIAVDDGSTDNSFEILKQIAAKNKMARIVKLISNYGQSNAIAAGISKCSGKIIVTMDSDMQHDPKDILPMVKKIEEGFHVVCGWRKYRGYSDSLIKKTVPSKISNFSNRPAARASWQTAPPWRVSPIRVLQQLPREQQFPQPAVH